MNFSYSFAYSFLEKTERRPKMTENNLANLEQITREAALAMETHFETERSFVPYAILAMAYDLPEREY